MVILISKQLLVVVSDIERDDIGHFLMVDYKLYGTRYIIDASAVDKGQSKNTLGSFYYKL